MIILIQKRHLFLFCVLFGCLLSVFVLGQGRDSQAVFAPREKEPIIFVVDPGHGGEDGGAVAGDGTVESQLNLAIALRLESLLRLTGVQTEMTRREDVSIYSDGAETLRQKKVSDLKNRVELINGLENSIMVSIHQNSLPSSPKTHGAQSFYNQISGADALASVIQERLNRAANVDHEKQAKKIGDSIYLMKHITAPGVIVECGFLSNEAETMRLGERTYQQQLALAIAAGCLEYLSGEVLS